ncbi:MAG: low temperature requirement protein A [Chloroflexota bacterium]
MVELRRNFRKWWQPPRKTIDRPAERRVTVLELFYDLVYVVLIAELAHSLAINVTPAGVGGFAFLFVIVWWAWFNGTSYHELHGNNDIRTRVFTFLQMFTVAAMAVFAHDALGAGSVGFALSITAFQLILVYLWWRTGIYDPDHRPLSRPYTLVYLFNALLYIASVLVAPPWRFTLWGIALIFSLTLPLYTRTMGRRNPALQEEVERTTAASPALVERFDLLTIIVIGEVVAGTIRGVAGQDQLSWTLGIAAGLGMLIAIGIWWIYFDFVSRHPPLPGISESTRWYFLHLPLTLGITVIGAAVFNLVEHSGDPLSAGVRWLLVGSVAPDFGLHGPVNAHAPASPRLRAVVPARRNRDIRYSGHYPGIGGYPSVRRPVAAGNGRAVTTACCLRDVDLDQGAGGGTNGSSGLIRSRLS